MTDNYLRGMIIRLEERVEKLENILSNEPKVVRNNEQAKVKCSCGLAADGTLYDEPLCESCLYHKLK